MPSLSSTQTRTRTRNGTFLAALLAVPPVALVTAPAVTHAATSDPAHATGSAPDGEHPTPAHNDGVLGPLRLGAFVGAGFPRPFSVEGILKIDDLVGIGLEYSELPQLSISGVDATLSALAADLRVFPLRNGFFVGLAVGHQHFAASSNVTLPDSLGTVSGQVTSDAWFLNPRIGFLWTWKPGFTVGIDAGAQIPVAESSTNTVPSELALNQTATDLASTVGRNVLPTVDLLRLGFLF